MKKMSTIQKRYAKALAAQRVVKEIEATVKTKILSENIFNVSSEWRPDETGRVTSPASDFLMSDEDFQIYSKLVHNEYANHGLKIPSDNTPDYKTAPALRKAEKELIEWGFSIIKKDPRAIKAIGELETLSEAITWDMKVRDQVIDLTMRLAV